MHRRPPKEGQPLVGINLLFSPFLLCLFSPLFILFDKK